MRSLILLEDHQTLPMEPIVAAVCEVLQRPPKREAEVLLWKPAALKANPIEGLIIACQEALEIFRSKPGLERTVYMLPRTLRDPQGDIVFEGLVAFQLTKGNFVKISLYEREGSETDVTTTQRVVKVVMDKLSGLFPSGDNAPDEERELDLLVSKVNEGIHLAHNRYTLQAGTT